MVNERTILGGKHFKSHVHWVFVTRHSGRMFDARAIDVLRDIFADACSDAQATLVEMDGEKTSD